VFGTNKFTHCYILDVSSLPAAKNVFEQYLDSNSGLFVSKKCNYDEAG
jgi:hypothetical protein